MINDKTKCVGGKLHSNQAMWVQIAKTASWAVTD
jgi:hypothetical protein